MKTGFSFSKRFVPTFQGNNTLNAAEQFVAVLSMPTTGDMFCVLERLQANGFQAGDSNSLSLAQCAGLLKEAGEFIPRYVKLENAEDFTVEDIVKYPPFFRLAVELLFALVQFAQPTEDDQKN